MASAGVVGVADDEAADDEDAVAVQDVDGRERRVADATSAFALRVLGRRLEEGEIVLEHVLDAEEHVLEAGALHQRREAFAMRGKRRRHPLHDVAQVVQVRPR